MTNKTNWSDYWSPEDNTDDLKDFRDNGHEIMDSSDMVPDLGLKDLPTPKSWETTNYKGILTPEEAAEMAVEAAKDKANEFSKTSTTFTPLTDEQLAASAAGTATVTYTGSPEYVQNVRDLVDGVNLEADIRSERQQELKVALMSNTEAMAMILKSHGAPENVANYINLLVIHLTS